VYFDDNYGHWEDMDDPDTVDFYFRVQRESVQKECQRCGRLVMLRPDYAICGSCADAIERGMDY
jgi:hypothetical protein